MIYTNGVRRPQRLRTVLRTLYGFTRGPVTRGPRRAAALPRAPRPSPARAPPRRAPPPRGAPAAPPALVRWHRARSASLW